MNPDMRAVIPAGGFGTRMLPATKSMPKEMLPVLDRPLIQYVVEEAADAGIEDIVIVSGRTKRAIEDHFDAAPELEALLAASGKHEALAELHRIRNLARIMYVRQDRPAGLGHAVLQAAPVVSGHPFAVLLGDDLVMDEPGATAQLRHAYEETGCSVLCVQEVAPADVSKYGIVEIERLEHGLARVVDIIEKPSPDDAPSNLASIGRYVFTPEIMPHLARTKPGVGGEIQLTDAIRTLLADQEVYCLPFGGVRLDAGSLGGWLEANLFMAQRRPELAERLQSWLQRP